MEKQILIFKGYFKNMKTGNKPFRRLLESLPSPYLYIFMMSLIFALSLFTDLLLSGTYFFTVAGLQISFAIVFILSAVYLFYLSITKKLEIRTVTTVIIFLGIVLRICYSLFTGSGTRTHDVYRDEWGHIDYIKHIAKYWSLPPVNTCQAYHPPVHHILSAVVLYISNLFTANEFMQIKYVQLASTFLNSLTLVFIYKLLKQLKLSQAAILAGTAFFAFHPTNVFFSSKINNDNTMFFFYTAAFYFLFKWMDKKTTKNTVFLSLFTALAVLSKISAVMLLVPISVVFAVHFFRNLANYKSYMKQFSVFILIFIPLSMSYPLRNYLLFQQKLGYVPSLGKGFEPNLYNLFYLPVENLFIHPFNNGGLRGGAYFTEFLLKSSLFGEWAYPGLEILGVLLIILTLLLIAIFLIRLFGLRKEGIKPYGYIFLLNLLVPLILAVKFRTDFPVACSQDFRYVAPILISMAYFLGTLADKNTMYSRNMLLRNIALGALGIFNLLSIIFLLSLGYYN
ncbi:MAG: glycosyltransferase family 39 protein [Clostridia bacterium]|nr:glycosyltransferase family 39 protein [Clostridia bacterium]